MVPKWRTGGGTWHGSSKLQGVGEYVCVCVDAWDMGVYVRECVRVCVGYGSLCARVWVWVRGIWEFVYEDVGVGARDMGVFMCGCMWR